MLPETEHKPTGLSKPLIRVTIACDIAQDFV